MTVRDPWGYILVKKMISAIWPILQSYELKNNFSSYQQVDVSPNISPCILNIKNQSINQPHRKSPYYTTHFKTIKMIWYCPVLRLTDCLMPFYGLLYSLFCN